MARKIENDEQLFKSLEWLVEKAKQLDHPLMEGEAKAKLMKQFDFVADNVIEYQRAQINARLPYLCKMDEALGLIDPQVQTVPDNQAPPQQDHAQEQKKQINLSDWMDDED